jgi:hypothetical protein
MATVTPPPARNIAEDRRRVRSPLDRLRGYIRAYVSLEGAAVVAIFLALWFWACLVLDFGLFKLLSFDWVQGWPLVFRKGLLVILLGALVALVVLKVGLRLFRDFRDTALALVLERRFPGILGDRLITAVELADQEKAALQGYSVAMVQETVHEAAERVDQLPIGQVFDWKRLFGMGFRILFLTAIGYGLAAGTFAAVAHWRDHQSAAHGMNAFHDVATIWFQRDVMMENVPWPRRAHLIQLEPVPDELRIGYDAAAPNVRVRGIKYVIADAGTYDGWRPLMLADLRQRPELRPGSNLVEPPGDWVSRYGENDLSADEIELRWTALPVRTKAAPGAAPLPAQYNVLSLDETAPWRPMLWSDLTAAGLGGMSVPPLSAKWDNRALPILAASCIGMEGSSLGFTAAAIAAVTGARPTPYITVDEVVELVGKPGYENITTRLSPTPGQLTNALAAGFALTGTPAGLLTEAALLSGLEKALTIEVNVSADVRAIQSRLDRLGDVRSLLDTMEQQLRQDSMSRTARVLKLPGVIHLSALTKGGSFEIPLARGSENEYSGQVTALKAGETIRYRVHGEDFYTPWKEITVLAPPGLLSLTCEQRQPAYLYYREGPGIRAIDLKGKKQVFQEIDISNFGTDVSKIDVPAGTDVIIRGKVNRPLARPVEKKADGNAEPKKAKLPQEILMEQLLHQGRIEILPDSMPVMIRPRRGSSLGVFGFVGTLTEKGGGQFDLEGDFLVLGAGPAVALFGLKVQGDSFELKIDNVRQELSFVTAFKDADGVEGYRSILVKPRDDLAPELQDVMPDDIIRKKKDQYIVTTEARIPFKGVVRDDFGLSGIRYAWTVQAAETGINFNVIALSMFAGAPFQAASRPGHMVAAAMYLDSIQRAANEAADAAGRLAISRSPVLPAFDKKLHEADGDPRRREFLHLSQLEEMLSVPQPSNFRRLTREFIMKPDDWMNAGVDPIGNDFPLWTAKLKVPGGDRAIQPRYKVQLWVEAVDTDVESEQERDGTPRPHVSPSKDRYIFLVVPEYELLAEIGTDEEGLNLRLRELVYEPGKVWNFKSMTEMDSDLTRDRIELDSASLKPADLGPMSLRIHKLADTLDKGQAYTQEILKTYENLIKEMRLNQVSRDYVDRKLRDVVNPLNNAVDELFPAAKDSMLAFEKALDAARKMPAVAGNIPETATARKAGDKARDDLRALKASLEKVIQSLQQLTDIAKLVKELRKLEEQKQQETELYKQILQKLYDDLLKGTGTPPPKP